MPVRLFALYWFSVLLTGTDGPDHLVAEACTLTVDGGAGNDRLVGANEPDFFDESDCTGVQFTLRGGSGADRISASAPGAQLVDGGSGADVLTGGASRGNEMRGGLGDDRLLGGDDPFQPDTLRGGPGADYLDGERGDDALFGDAGDDELYGDVGDDTADGGADDDLCRAETTPRTASARDPLPSPGERPAGHRARPRGRAVGLRGHPRRHRRDAARPRPAAHLAGDDGRAAAARRARQRGAGGVVVLAGRGAGRRR